MKKLFLFLAFFSIGYMTNDLAEKMNIDLIQPVSADVAGMDYYDLKSDNDFKKAVKSIVNNCMVDGDMILC